MITEKKGKLKKRRAAGHILPSEVMTIYLDATSDCRNSRRAAARGLLSAARLLIRGLSPPP
jgi:hypothetical protein